MLGPLLFFIAFLLWWALVAMPESALTATAVTLLAPLITLLALLFKLSSLLLSVALWQRTLLIAAERGCMHLLDHLLAAEDSLYK